MSQQTMWIVENNLTITPSNYLVGSTSAPDNHYPSLDIAKAIVLKKRLETEKYPKRYKKYQKRLVPLMAKCSEYFI